MFPEDEAGEEGQEGSSVRDVDENEVGSSDPERSPEGRADQGERSGVVDAPMPEAIATFLKEPASTPSALRADATDFGGSNEVMARPRPSRDVVIPRLAVLSWSLFVLIALFLAFVAGLLVGHFVWR